VLLKHIHPLVSFDIAYLFPLQWLSYPHHPRQLQEQPGYQGHVQPGKCKEFNKNIRQDKTMAYMKAMNI
jgi:hypothetical protein